MEGRDRVKMEGWAEERKGKVGRGGVQKG